MSFDAASDTSERFDRRSVPLAGALPITAKVAAAALEMLRGHAAVQRVHREGLARLRAKSPVERILTFSRSGVSEQMPVKVQSVVADALITLRAAMHGGVDLATWIDAGDASVVDDLTRISNSR